MAAKGVQFSWRWNGGTISLNLRVIWEMSVKKIAEALLTSCRRLRAGACAALAAGCLTLSGPALADKPPVDGILAETFTWLTPPVFAPQTPFQTGSGQETRLEAFRGRVVVLNFWATWCAPCIREMPSLDRLQAKLRDEGLEVVAVSQDFAGLKVVKPFFERLDLANLELYLNSGGQLARAIGVVALPTTFLIDRDGRLVGGVEGPAEWDSEEAVRLIRHYIEHPKPA